MSGSDYDSDSTASVATIRASQTASQLDIDRLDDRHNQWRDSLSTLTSGDIILLPNDKRSRSAFPAGGSGITETAPDNPRNHRRRATNKARTRPITEDPEYARYFDRTTGTITETWPDTVDVDSIVTHMRKAQSLGIPVPRVLDWDRSGKEWPLRCFVTTEHNFANHLLSDVHTRYGDLALDVVSPQIRIICDLLSSNGIFHTQISPSLVHVDDRWNICEIRGWHHCTRYYGPQRNIGSFRTWVMIQRYYHPVPARPKQEWTMFPKRPKGVLHDIELFLPTNIAPSLHASSTPSSRVGSRSLTKESSIPLWSLDGRSQSPGLSDVSTSEIQRIVILCGNIGENACFIQLISLNGCYRSI
jgi:hypothetical protein